MTWAEFLITIHILAAIVWLGGSIMLLIQGYALKSADLERRAEFTRTTEKLGPRVFAPTSLLLIIAGSLLVDELGYGYSDTWVTIGYAGWLISFLLGIGFYAREGKKREALIESEGIQAAGVAASLNRVLTVATVDTLIITLVVLDMTTKPGL